MAVDHRSIGGIWGQHFCIETLPKIIYYDETTLSAKSSSFWIIRLPLLQSTFGLNRDTMTIIKGARQVIWRERGDGSEERLVISIAAPLVGSFLVIIQT